MPLEPVDVDHPVVTVLGNALGGAMVRWHRNLDDARNMRPMLTATPDGVEIGGGWLLTSIPDEWVAAAKAAHRALKDGEDVSGLATHRGRFGDSGGPLDPVADGTDQG